MTEEGNKPYFDEVVEEENTEGIPQYIGICDGCLGSGYRVGERNGVIGVLFTSTMTDSEGKPVKKLIPCDCGVDVTY